jgi:hypothetical protein
LNAGRLAPTASERQSSLSPVCPISQADWPKIIRPANSFGDYQFDEFSAPSKENYIWAPRARMITESKATCIFLIDALRQIGPKFGSRPIPRPIWLIKEIASSWARRHCREVRMEMQLTDWSKRWMLEWNQNKTRIEYWKIEWYGLEWSAKGSDVWKVYIFKIECANTMLIVLVYTDDDAPETNWMVLGWKSSIDTMTGIWSDPSEH